MTDVVVIEAHSGSGYAIQTYEVVSDAEASVQRYAVAVSIEPDDAPALMFVTHCQTRELALSIHATMLLRAMRVTT